jgi:hypothetical protein
MRLMKPQKIRLGENCGYPHRDTAYNNKNIFTIRLNVIFIQI